MFLGFFGVGFLWNFRLIFLVDMFLHVFTTLRCSPIAQVSSCLKGFQKPSEEVEFLE